MKVLGNTFLQLAGRLLSAGFAFVTTIILARMLGAAVYGEYTKVVTVILLVYVLSDFGLNALYLKHAHEKRLKPETLFPRFLGVRLGWVGIIFLVGFPLLLFMQPLFPQLTPLLLSDLFVGLVAITSYTVTLSVTAVFQSRLRYDLAAMLPVLNAIAVLAVVTIPLFFRAAPETFYKIAIWAFAVGALVSALFGLLFVRRFTAGLWPQFSFSYWKELLAPSVPLGLVLVLNVIYFRLDVLILSYYRSNVEIGTYGFAYKFFEFAITVPTFVMNSLYPILLKLDKRLLEARILRLCGQLSVLGVLAAVFLFVAAPLLISIKQDYAPSIQFLRLLTFSVPVYFATSPLMWWYVLRGEQGSLVKIYTIGLLSNFLLNLWLIPQYGAAAAAIVTGLSEGVILVCSLVPVLRGKEYAV